MLGLGVAIYSVYWRTHCREIASVGDQAVVLEIGSAGPRRRHEFSRAWTHLALRRTGAAWQHDRFARRTHGREVDIEAFLTNTEREQLIAAMWAHARLRGESGAGAGTYRTDAVRMPDDKS